MTAVEYEDFIRNAFSYTTRRLENGADADIFRGLESKFAEYSECFNEQGKPIDPEMNSSKVLISYNREGKKVAEFVLSALVRYQTSFHLNDKQIEALGKIVKKLSINMTLGQIEESIASAIDVMKSKLQIHFSTDGFLNSPAYTFHVPTDFNEYIHQFGELEELELRLHEVPLSIIGKYPEKPYIIATDGKKLIITVEQNKYYKPNGTPNGAPKPFEVLHSVKLRLSGAIQFYNDWLKEMSEKKTGGEKTEEKELPKED